MSEMTRRFFLLKWVAFVTVTLAPALMAAFLTMWSISEIVERTWGEAAGVIIAGALFGALAGGGIALGQAVVLRSHGVPPFHWVIRSLLAGAAGMALGFTIVFNLFDLDTMPAVFAGLSIAFSIGLPVSLVQWTLLPVDHVRARLWIPILTGAFIVGFGVGLNLEDWPAVLLVAVLTAVVSGAGLVWLAGSETTAAVV